ncbi:MAG: ADP-ribosylglycohydrolase family protein [Planctomycetota bacterium]
MNALHPLLVFVSLTAGPLTAKAAELPAQPLELSADQLADKIRGGLLGQLLGNLNGLPHEMKYIDRPGSVERYTPALPDGARTDDDTDLEWVYIVTMQREQTVLLPPQRITELWKTHINQRIWCSNHYARRLMDIGIDPPLTGDVTLNPWADFNISGQFVCETFGLIAPGMPQRAARIGLNYTRVTIDGEPAQTTQLFTAMIATAFTTGELEKILDSGVAAVDPKSATAKIVTDVRRWHRQHPDDWRAARGLVKEKYSRHGGAMRDRNGYELNTAATIAALLYGGGDFVETLRTAFNFGWDADNNAASAGTIVGVIKGHRWMQAHRWQIRDRYRNTSRPGMPEDETITRFAERLAELAERVIIEGGGRKLSTDGRTVYRIRTESPGNVYPLADPARQLARLRRKLKPEIEAALGPGTPPQQRARAAYLAVCLDLAEPLRCRDPDRWSQAVAALGQYPKLLRALQESPTPAAARLRERAKTAGALTPSGRN